MNDFNYVHECLQERAPFCFRFFQKNRIPNCFGVTLTPGKLKSLNIREQVEAGSDRRENVFWSCLRTYTEKVTGVTENEAVKATFVTLLLTVQEFRCCCKYSIITISPSDIHSPVCPCPLCQFYCLQQTLLFLHMYPPSALKSSVIMWEKERKRLLPSCSITSPNWQTPPQSSSSSCRR